MQAFSRLSLAQSPNICRRNSKKSYSELLESSHLHRILPIRNNPQAINSSVSQVVSVMSALTRMALSEKWTMTTENCLKHSTILIFKKMHTMPKSDEPWERTINQHTTASEIDFWLWQLNTWPSKFPKCSYDHIWPHHDTDLWPLDHKIKSVCLYPQVQLSCKFGGKISTGGL